MPDLFRAVPVQSWILLIIAVAVAFALLAVVRAVLFRRGPKTYILVDGSNVMHWRNETPDITPVKAVVQLIRENGAVPVVWFDANAGYLIWDRYRGDHYFAQQLGLPERQVHIAPKGTPADPLLLSAAAKLDAMIVTNDRFRDWVDEYPILQEEGVLLRGRFENGRVELRHQRLSTRGKKGAA